MDVDAKPIPLADFLTALRGELKAARAERDPDLSLEVGPVTVEFTVLTRQEGEGKAGIRFWVVDAGVSGKLTGEATQKVTLQLTPPRFLGRESAGAGHRAPRQLRGTWRCGASGFWPALTDDGGGGGCAGGAGAAAAR